MHRQDGGGSGEIDVLKNKSPSPITGRSTVNSFLYILPTLYIKSNKNRSVLTLATEK